MAMKTNSVQIFEQAKVDVQTSIVGGSGIVFEHKYIIATSWHENNFERKLTHTFT